MDPLELVIYPDPRLNQPCEPVAEDEFGDSLRETVREMFRIMYKNRGVGLAGPQAGVNKRIVTLNLAGKEGEGEEIVLVNPRIVSTEGTEAGDEGCLSFPGIRGKVKRAACVKAEYSDLDGNLREAEAEGFMARAFQHEGDHLDGILFVTRMSPAQRFLVRGQLKDLEREYKKNARK